MRINLHGNSASFLIDDEYFYLKQYKWYLSKQGYARRLVKVDGKYSYRYAHWDVIGNKDGYIIDHINRNRLDNRASNLRHLTYSQNMANSKANSRNVSGFRGVSLIGGKWRAKIHISGKDYILGRFSSKETAANEYRKVYFEWYGHNISDVIASEMRGAA